MGTHKSLAKKKKLASAWKKSRPVPLWVVAKTMGRVRRTPSRRHWRRSKIKIKTD